uniref:YqeB family protein n=1 Tax=Nesterenkonia sp. TaxID=704201 RepID=UPI002634516A
MSETSITVTVDSKLMPAFAGVGAALGFGAAWAVGPVVSWLLDRVDSAPAPLRLIDQLPLVWSLPLLTVLGAVAGWIVFSLWNEEVGSVVVDPEKVRVHTKASSAEFTRDEVAEIFLDKDQLVLVDAESQELSRTSSDSGLAGKLGEAFRSFDYPWRGAGDPRDAEFVEWVDRSGPLEEPVHALLRARRRALADGKNGEAEALREQL